MAGRSEGDCILVRTKRGFAVRALPEARTPAASSSGEGAGGGTFQTLTGMGPYRNRSARVLNACGALRCALESRAPSHSAWQPVHTVFGAELHAYTAFGNLCIQIRNALFRGAVDPASLRRVARTLLQDAVADADAVAPAIHLVVMQASMGRSLFVHIGCLLDRQIEEHAPWARLCNRCEELCNVVSFLVVDWPRALEALGLPPLPQAAPDTATVSVTRRGFLTVRLTWVEGVPWESNDWLLGITDSIARFVKALV